MVNNRFVSGLPTLFKHKFVLTHVLRVFHIRRIDEISDGRLHIPMFLN